VAAGRLGVEALECRLAPATLSVNSTADSASPTDPYLSLREAIAIFNSPTLPSGLSDQILGQISGTLHEGGTDTIQFDPSGVTGPIVLGGTQLELSLPGSTAAVTIDGGGGVTVNGNDTSRVLQVDAGVRATFDHLTISHGRTTNPGGYDGGGVFNHGTLTVSNSTLSDNSAGFGGGIESDGTLTVSHSTLSANSASYGGGVYNNYGTLTVSNSTLSANSASSAGGSSGGGIDNYVATASVSNSTLSDNSADTGGGIENILGTLTVSNSTLSSNSAIIGGGSAIFGGGIDNYFGTVTVSNSTLSANSADFGGGIYNLQGTLRLQNTLVAGNRATNSSPDIFGGVQAGSRSNLVGIGDSNLSGIRNGIDGNLIGSPFDPIDSRLGPLADNGGPTLTQALLPDSPARGAGNLDFATDTDQRGLPRVVDGQTDLGAYQTQTPVAGPRVAVSEPGGVLDPPVDHVRLTFNHPMGPSNLTTAEVHLSGPAGSIALTAVAAVPSTNDQQFDLMFPAQTQPGDYALVLSPAVRDVYGNPPDDPSTPLFIVAGLPGCTLTVNSTLDTADPTAPYLTLREALTIVNGRTLPDGLSPQILGQINGPLHRHGADRIVFDPARVTDSIQLGGSQLDLSQSAGVARVTIDGGGGVTLDGAGRSRVLQVAGGVQATLDHLTVTHGSVPLSNYGGGIYNQGNLIVRGSTITSNSSGYGGGIYNDRGTLTVSHSTLSANTVTYFGGGIYNDHGTITVSGSALSSNTAAFNGGGIDNTSGTVTVSDSTLSANSARDYGGGIYSIDGTVAVSQSIFRSNSDRGIFNTRGTVTVSNSTFTAHSVGIWNDSGTVTVSHSAFSGSLDGIVNFQGTLTVSNSTVSGNTYTGISNSSGTLVVIDSTLSGAASPYDGGGISNTLGLVTVSNCTLFANSARQGGGIYNDRGTLRLQNTLVAGNRATSSGPDINGEVDSDSGYNLVGDGTGLSGISDGANHNQIGTAASPIDPRLSPLAYYGGPTQTYALLPNSPARGAGDSALTDTDQRGQPRLVGPTDVGAFQSQADPFLVTTLLDPGRLSGLLSLREAVALANVLPGDNTVSFAGTLDGGVVLLTAGQLELSGSGGLEAIDGAGRFTLDGNAGTRLVQVDPGTQAALRGLALVNGNAPNGAGVYNRGTLAIADCVLYGNTAYAGGAVLNQGDLTLWGSTLAFNVATLGAALDNEGLLTAFNSTFVYNAALSAGGAIRNAATGTAILTSLTISRNSADEGGGLDVLGGLVVLRNCIVAGNYTAGAVAASDIAGTVDSSSTYNLIGPGGSGGLSDGNQHNLVGVADPGLTTPDFSSPLTPVFGFTADSPALGAGDLTLLDDPLLRLDQHGNERTVVNIGAL
jgi:hypothetical protein